MVLHLSFDSINNEHYNFENVLPFRHFDRLAINMKTNNRSFFFSHKYHTATLYRLYVIRINLEDCDSIQKNLTIAHVCNLPLQCNIFKFSDRRIFIILSRVYSTRIKCIIQADQNKIAVTLDIRTQKVKLLRGLRSRTWNLSKFITFFAGRYLLNIKIFQIKMF